MKRPFKTALLGLLTLCLLLPLCAVTPLAYGAEDQTLIITHINVQNSYEGAAILLSGKQFQTVTYNFAWWKVLIFDWDPAQNCFVLTDKDLVANGSSDKGKMPIPENGFAYGLCVGNDYSSSGGINYITDRMKACYSYVDSLNIGDKAYLYGVSLTNAQIQNNGKAWYASDFVSKSYIKIGSPVAGETACDPTNEAEAPLRYEIYPNHVNSTHYATGDCNLFTSEFGLQTPATTGGYGWWSCAVFAWDAANGCYTCLQYDPVAGASNIKRPPIPDGGFVLMDCGSDSKNALSTAHAGTKAYLYKDGSTYTVTLNQPLENKTQVKPANADKQMNAVTFRDVPANKTFLFTEKGGSVAWDAVEGATGYRVTLLNSSANAIGSGVLETTTVTDTKLDLTSAQVQVGCSYTLYVSAIGENAVGSVPSLARIFCTTETALSSRYRDKTVLAFGDSLTARTGWVSMLGAYIGTEVINAGVGGDSTNNGKARFKQDVLDRDPDVVLICFGMNDQAQVISASHPNVSLETYRSNMEHFITELQKRGAEVILIAPHDAYNGTGYYTPGGYGLDYSFGNMKDFCDVVRSLAEEYHCGLVDIYTATQNEDMTKLLNPGDGIHQSTAGHQYWADMVGTYMNEYTPVPPTVDPADPSDTTSESVGTESSEEIEVTSSEADASASPDSSEPDSSEGRSIYSVLAAVAIAVILLCAVIAVRKKKKQD